MWTPKRVILVLAAFGLLFTSYRVYAHFLGGIDGLPPLPAEFLPQPGGPGCGGGVETTQPPPSADEKLRMAFGSVSEELARSIKIEIRNRGLVVASNSIEIIKEPGEHNGQVLLTPFSIAIFGKTLGPGGIPEINTVSSDRAYLTFDRPISSITELSTRKIIAAELRRDEGSPRPIKIINNRKTLGRDDDLFLYTSGPIFFNDARHLIWTDAEVKVTDLQGKPEPTEISGVGMEVKLASDVGTSGKPSAKKPKNETVSGVESIKLRSNVAMYLYVDSRSGFLAASKAEPAQGRNGPEPAPPAAGAGVPAQPQKSKVVILNQGPFFYDLVSDKANFKRPENAQGDARLPDPVQVTRDHGDGKKDQLGCDVLDLTFHRKSARAGQDGQSVSLEIQEADATGKEVILSSDAEGLYALGNHLHYNALTQESTLEGERQLEAVKDGHHIFARDLHLKTGTDKNLHEAKAKGPGHIDMRDHDYKLTQHAVWTNTLTYLKDGRFDCLTLVGDAAFRDDVQKQELRADQIKVWFEPAEPGANPDNGQRARPHHIEAIGHVTANSPDLKITASQPAEHLEVWFRNVPARDRRLPDPSQTGARPAPAGSGPATAQAPPGGETPRGPRASADASPAPDGSGKPAPKKPITLAARSIEVHAVSADNKTDLEKLWCEGAVWAHRDPTPPSPEDAGHPASDGDKGMDIQGDTLELDHFPAEAGAAGTADPGGSNVLVVTCKPESREPAKVQLDKLTINGPEVHIDQKTNNAWVNGPGAMQMPASTDLNGKKLSGPGELLVNWNKDMFFNGNCAEFHGGVTAQQGNGRLLCQDMQVFLDRSVSFKGNDKGGGQAAKVRTVVCDQRVQVEDATWDPATRRLVEYHRLTAPEVNLDNEEGIVRAPGPGLVHVLQMGGAEENGPGASPRKDPNPQDKGKQELKLTRVNYLGHMHANNKTRTAIFYDDVRVINVPTDNPDLVINLEHPPPGCMNLSCEQLTVFKGQEGQQMEARKRVTVQSQEFWGSAEVVKYNEGKEQVIFEGGDGGLAVLYKQKAQGAAPDRVTGKKITYYRRTGEFKIEGGMDIRAQ